MITKGLISSLCIVLSCLTLSSDASKPDPTTVLLDKLATLDKQFTHKGSTFEVLQEYSDLLNDFINLNSSSVTRSISGILYKQGVINYSMRRDKQALQDFDSCINYDNFFYQGCFDKYIDLCFQSGYASKIEDKLEQFSAYIPSSHGTFISEKLSTLKSLNDKLNEVYSKDKYEESIEVSKKSLELSPSNSHAKTIQIDCYKKVKDYPFSEKLNSLVRGYVDLIKMGDQNLDNYVQLFKLQYFGESTESPSLPASRVLKNCLKIDNDFQECRRFTKIATRLNRLIRLVKQTSTYYSFLYLKLEDESGDIYADPKRIQELEPNVGDWKNLNTLLFDKGNLIKLRGNEEDLLGFPLKEMHNNFEVVLQLIINNLKDFGFDEDDILGKSEYLNNIFTMARESYIWMGKTTHKELDDNAYYKKYLELNSEEQDGKLYLAETIIEAEQLFNNRKFTEALEKLEDCPQNFKETRIWKDLHGKLNNELEKQNRYKSYQQQREYQKQRQRQQYEYQQQQRQSSQMQQMTPKNDYYKVLGIEKDADVGAIKKAYREKMKQNHPDKLLRNSDLTSEQIEDKVAEINNAYEVLSDSEKKSQYDNYGHDPNDPMAMAQQQQQPRDAQAYQFRHAHQMFQNMFGGSGTGGGNFQFRYGSFQNGNTGKSRSSGPTRGRKRTNNGRARPRAARGRRAARRDRSM